MEGDQTKWIDEEFLKLAISDGNENESVTITDYSIKPAVESGNNYCSQLFRVKVNYHRGNVDVSKSLIIKAPLAEGRVKSLIDEAGLLKNEYTMYTEILPKINAISKQQFGPKTYFCEREDVLIMDDLTEDGFTMGDRLKQLDLQHCKQFLTTLAQYHAATVVLHRQNPELVEINGVHPFYNESTEIQTMLYFEQIKLKAFIKIVQKLRGMEELANAIQSCEEHLRSGLVKMFKRKGPLSVLNHGDCWTNNIMFKYSEEGKITDCKLIDFQVRSYGSPAVDLLYFLFTSAKSEVRREHMDELLKLYCDTLNETLQELACSESLSLRGLQEEMRLACPWAVFFVANYLPMILNEPDELTEKLKENPENMKNPDINENPRLRMFLGKTYNAVLPDVCYDLVKLGVIDYLRGIDK